MDNPGEFETEAKRVIDTNLYLALGTADASGEPWVSPVYFTPERYTDFYWVSSPSLPPKGSSVKAAMRTSRPVDIS